MNPNLNDRMRMENLNKELHLQKCDPFITRLFKSENDYLKEGYKAASKVYSRLIEELNIEHKKRALKFEEANLEKKRLIDELIFTINKLRKDSSNEDNDEKIRILIRCLDVFNDDVNSISSKDIKYLRLDNKFSDWRHVYGISKKY